MKFLRFYLEVSLVSEEKIKKEDNGEIAFALISLLHVQVQESCNQVTN